MFDLFVTNSVLAISFWYLVVLPSPLKRNQTFTLTKQNQRLGNGFICMSLICRPRLTHIYTYLDEPTYLLYARVYDRHIYIYMYIFTVLTHIFTVYIYIYIFSTALGAQNSPFIQRTVRMMASWTQQMGFPVLEVNSSDLAGKYGDLPIVCSMCSPLWVIMEIPQIWL